MLSLPLTLTLAATLVAANAEPTPACGARAEVLAQLAERYHEAPAGIGLTPEGSLVELLTADAGATWTLIVTTPNGASCVFAAGEDWQPLRRVRLEGPGI